MNLSTNIQFIYKDDKFCYVKVPFIYKDIVKAYGGATWNKKEKMWEIPVNGASALSKVLEEAFCNVKVDERLQGAIDFEHNRAEELKRILSQETFEEQGILLQHQIRCMEIAKRFNRFAFFLDTGTGKTVLALSIINSKPNITYLISSPVAIMKTAWLEDAEKFYPDLKILPINMSYFSLEYYGSLAKKWGVTLPWDITKVGLVDMLKGHADAFLCNPEHIRARVDDIAALPFNGVIIDESTVIKSHSSQISKIMHKLTTREETESVYILSGKPAPNTEMDYYSQMYAVDKSLLGRNYYSFRSRFFLSDFMGYNYTLRPEMHRLFSMLLATKSIFISKEDCLDLPAKTYETRTVSLPKEAMKQYRSMAKEFIIALRSKDITVDYKLSAIAKLSQMANGFVYDEDGNTHVLHKAKIKELLNVIELLGGKSVIVWVKYKADVAMISEALEQAKVSYVGAYSQTKNVFDSIDDFKSGKAQVLIAHPQTLKYGVTLTNCDTCVYYGKTYSYEDYYQSHDRIYRYTQEKPCTFISIVADKTIDMVIEKSLERKGGMASVMEGLVKEHGNT